MFSWGFVRGGGKSLSSLGKCKMTERAFIREELLGKMSDEAVAEISGCSSSAVRNRRISLKIAPYKVRKPGIDWDQQPLGEVPDKELARKLGCAPNAVYYQRTKRGIPVFQRRRQNVQSSD